MNFNLFKKKKAIPIALIITAMLVACSSTTNSNDNQTPPANQSNDTPVLQNNNMVKIDVPSGWNSFKINDPVVLIIRNISSEDIVFQLDYSAQIYINKNGNWIQLKNKMTYSGLDEIILEPSTLLT